MYKRRMNHVNDLTLARKALEIAFLVSGLCKWIT